jgi:hypothetical protein
MMKSEEVDYKLAVKQLLTGKPLFGKDGALASMLEWIMNAALEGVMDAHLPDLVFPSWIAHPSSAKLEGRALLSFEKQTISGASWKKK